MTAEEPDRFPMPDKGLPSAGLIGRHLFDGGFPLPTAILHADALAHNVHVMARYCADHDVLLAPHGKTTMCPEIVARQLAAGAWGMTVATAWQAGVIAGMRVPRLILANQVVDPGSLRLLGEILAGYPDIEIYAYADSVPSLRALESLVDGGGRLRVLVELGVHGGRTGLRDDAAALELAREVAAGPLPLAGVSAFEGTLAGADLAATLSLVDTLLGRMVVLARAMHDSGLLATDGRAPIVTAGGSSFFDRVVALLPDGLRGTPYRTVLRSGCYATHDAGLCQALSPFGAHPRGLHRLREALRVWAPVLSRPEPGLALVGLGRRDVSFDAGLPVPRLVRRSVHHDRQSGAATGASAEVWPADPRMLVTALNDQHGYLDLPAGLDLAVGDLICFGISHPCTTFDKWRAIPIVDADHTVIELAHTYF